jgi:alpha-galactosidase
MKVDWCHTAGLRGRTTYPKWTEAILAARRPMVLSISEWSRDQPWEWAGTVGHMWRTTSDIADAWSIITDIADRQVDLHQYAGPDHWNDPDMLEVGNGGMSEDEYRTHFSLWAMLAAPLMAGNDVREMTDATRAILTAPEVIAIDQDPRGAQARRIRRDETSEVWARPLASGEHAVLLVNRGEARANVVARWDDVLGAKGSRGGRVRDLWERADIGERDGYYDRMLEAHASALVKVAFA